MRVKWKCSGCIECCTITTNDSNEGEPEGCPFGHTDFLHAVWQKCF